VQPMRRCHSLDITVRLDCLRKNLKVAQVMERWQPSCTFALHCSLYVFFCYCRLGARSCVTLTPLIPDVTGEIGFTMCLTNQRDVPVHLWNSRPHWCSVEGVDNNSIEQLPSSEHPP